MKKAACVLMLVTSTAAFAQQRESFLKQQAFAEMQRVAAQIDVVQSNLNNLQSRIDSLERAAGEGSMRQEIDALRNAVAELRREMANQRGEIVKDLSGRLAKLQKETALATKQASPTATVVSGPHREYVVKGGDTLSLISEAFGCSIKQIKEMNGLKNDNLRIGQKLILPKE